MESGHISSLSSHGHQDDGRIKWKPLTEDDNTKSGAAYMANAMPNSIWTVNNTQA